MIKVKWDLYALDNEFSLMSKHSQESTVGGFNIMPIPTGPYVVTDWLIDIIFGTCH
ncbi:hypothetical protein [uncultured Ruminococcus sp.]|uniref:hypothetical protein n=1 Tax=uncultured Ruminococcus sp. TaxID=165186 RepID=UPI00266CC566|nr:hypothetical protein [uncultured Ruminococcus sp.]